MMRRGELKEEVGLMDQHWHGVREDGTEEETRSWESCLQPQDEGIGEGRRGHSGGSWRSYFIPYIFARVVLQGDTQGLRDS